MDEQEEFDDGYVEGMEAETETQDSEQQEEGELAPEGEEESQEAPPAEEEAAAEEYQAAAPTPYQGGEDETEDDAYIREQFGDEAYRAMTRIYDRKVERATQSWAASSTFVAAEASRRPELFRVHGAAIQRNLSQLPANIRGTQAGIDTAIMGIMLEESQGEGGLQAALARMNTLMGGKAQAKEAQAKPAKTALPPSQRPPAASGAAPSRTAPVSARESLVRSLMREEGLSRGEAEMVASDPKVGGNR